MPRKNLIFNFMKFNYIIESTKVVPRSNLEFLKKKINIQNIKNRERILKSVWNAYSVSIGNHLSINWKLF